MNTYGIALIIALAILVILYLVDRISGKNTLLYLVAGKPILSALSLLAKAIGSATGNSWFDTVYVAMCAAINATEKAEQLWKNGDLPKDQREDYATLMIEQTLKDAGIVVTDDLETVISGIVALTAMLLPHEVKPAPEKPKEVDLE